MTTKQHDDIKRLFKLATISQEFEFVDIKLIDHWCTLREEHGLAALLLLIQEYGQAQTGTQTLEVTNPNQDSSVVQQLRTSIPESPAGETQTN